jgi:hypothetical protein
MAASRIGTEFARPDSSVISSTREHVGAGQCTYWERDPFARATEQSDRTYLRLRGAVPEWVNRDFGQMLRIK